MNLLGVALRTPIIVGNWKMNLLRDDAVALARGVGSALDGATGVDVVVCPVFTVLGSVADALAGEPVEVGGQNCYVKESGAFTGEVSPQMLLDAGCAWTIVGHSERRQIFDESDALLNKKLHYALASGLKVMFCVGETLEERESGAMNDVLRRQVVDGLKGLKSEDFVRVVVAYEPVWAIGTGVTASPEQAEEAHAFVRGLVADEFGGTVAAALRIQYGGSVKPGNAAELLAKDNVDGALVGGASLQADDFAAIVNAAR
jgi:triosephosphate isomerase